VCSLWRAEEGQDAKFYAETEDGECGHFKPKSQFVEFPCKVGDTVYRISKRYGKWEVLPREVEGVGHFGDLNGETKWLIFSTTADWLGDTVFVAEEEAKAEVNRRNNG
jgi:hypothetical protein